MNYRYSKNDIITKENNKAKIQEDINTMNEIGKDGKPLNKRYLEIELPRGVQKDIDNYLEAKRTNDSYLDCYWCELYGTINSYQVADLITKEQADYLREKYLGMEMSQ